MGPEEERSAVKFLYTPGEELCVAPLSKAVDDRLFSFLALPKSGGAPSPQPLPEAQQSASFRAHEPSSDAQATPRSSDGQGQRTSCGLQSASGRLSPKSVCSRSRDEALVRDVSCGSCAIPYLAACFRDVSDSPRVASTQLPRTCSCDSITAPCSPAASRAGSRTSVATAHFASLGAAASEGRCACDPCDDCTRAFPSAYSVASVVCPGVATAERCDRNLCDDCISAFPSACSTLEPAVSIAVSVEIPEEVPEPSPPRAPSVVSEPIERPLRPMVRAQLPCLDEATQARLQRGSFTSEDMWCTCPMMGIASSDSDSAVLRALSHAAEVCACPLGDYTPEQEAQDDVEQVVPERLAPCLQLAMRHDDWLARAAPDTPTRAPAPTREPAAFSGLQRPRSQELPTKTVASTPDTQSGASNENSSRQGGSESNNQNTEAVPDNPAIGNSIRYPIVQVLLYKSLNIHESTSFLDKNTQEDESLSEEYNVPCAARQLLDQILPNEKLNDVGQKKKLLCQGLQDLLEVLTLSDLRHTSIFSSRSRRRDVRSLVDTMIFERESKVVTSRRSDVRKKIVDILERYAKPEQTTYMSQVSPLLQDLVGAVISAEQTSSTSKRGSFRHGALSIIDNLLKFSDQEREQEVRHFHDIMNFILEELFPSCKVHDKKQARKQLKVGLTELISQVTATKDPDAECIEGRHSRNCRLKCKELHMNIKTFMKMAIPDEEIVHSCKLSRECQEAIQNLLEYCVPLDMESEQSLRGVLRTQVHQLLAVLCRGLHHVEEPQRGNIREITKEHLIGILTITKIESQRRYEESKEVVNILDKIIPEGETENIYQQRNSARRGIEELIDKITPTTDKIEMIPARDASKRKSTFKRNTASLKVPQLVNQLYPHKPSKVSVGERRKTLAVTDDLVESVLPSSEASQDFALTELRDDIQGLFSTLNSLEGGQLEMGAKGRSEIRSAAQKRLHSIIRRAVAKEEQKNRAFHKNIEELLYSILSAGEIDDAIQRRNILYRNVYKLFETAIPSIISSGGKVMSSSVFTRSSCRAVGSILPRRSTLSRDVKGFIDTIADKNKSDYTEVQNALQKLLENVVSSSEAEEDVLLNEFRHEVEKLMEILMSFEKCIHDPSKKNKMGIAAYGQINRMLQTVEEISLRSSSQWRQELEGIIDKLLPDIDNPSKFERKCTLRRGIEDILGKVLADKNMESIMLKRTSEPRKGNLHRRNTLCEVLQMFVENVIPEKEDEFTIERRNRLKHVLQDLIDIIIPSAVCKEYSAQNYLRSNLKELMETIIIVHDVGDKKARRKARHLIGYRVENVLRDAEIMEIQRRSELLEEIDNFINKIFSEGKTESIFEKKHRIRQGIEELLEKLLPSGEDQNVMPITTPKRLSLVRGEIKKFVKVVILDGREWDTPERRDIYQVKRTLVDTVIPPSEAEGNIILNELQGDIEGVLESVAEMEQVSDPVQREQIRSAAREHLENVVTAVEFERERRNLQVYTTTENILNKIIPEIQISDISERRRTLHRGVEELSEKAASTTQGEIMMLRRIILPGELILARKIKKMVLKVLQLDETEDSPERRSKIHSFVEDLLEKIIPSSECQDSPYMHEMRESMQELLGTVVPAALNTSDPQKRSEFREVARSQLESVVRNSDLEVQKKRSHVHNEMQSILVKLLPGDDIGDELRKKMIRDGIEDLLTKIRATVKVERRPTYIADMETAELRAEIEEIADQLLPKTSARESSERKSRARSSVEGLLRKNLPLAATPVSPALVQLHRETHSLLADLVPCGLAERNFSRRSLLQEKALEHLQAIVHAAETQHKQTLEKIDEVTEEMLDKIIPTTNDTCRPQIVLQEGIHEVLEKVIPSTDVEESRNLSMKVATFVRKISQTDNSAVDESRKKSLDESRKDVHEFMDSVFLAEDVEFGESVDDIEDLLINCSQAQSEPDEGRRSSLRDRTRPIVEKLVARSFAEREPQVMKMANGGQTILLALNQPGSIIPISELSNPLPCDGKRRGIFGSLFPWKGKMFSRRSRRKSKSKVEIEGMVSKTHKKTVDKRKLKENRNLNEKLRNDIFDLP